MKIQTKYFGEIDYEKEELLTFEKGLFGFENEHDYLLIPFSAAGTMFSLQSVATPGLAFTLMHPFSLDPSYAPVLSEEDLKTLGVSQSEELYYYVLCTVREPVGESTINMKCPLAINPDTRRGIQAMLEGDEWGMRQTLGEFEERRLKKC